MFFQVSRANLLSLAKQQCVDFLTTKYFDRRGVQATRFSFGWRISFEQLINRGAIDSIWARSLAFRSLSVEATKPSQAELLPSIEVLIVAAGKDLDRLSSCIKHAQQGSHNQVNKLTVVVPKQDLEGCTKAVTRLRANLDFELLVICEDTLLPQETTTNLRRNFQGRYGWVLQQLLKLRFVEDSSLPGVLIIDSDTSLLAPRTWLLPDFHQLLLVTSELNLPYYRFLQSLGLGSDKPRTTHVSHHMLMQPGVLQDILKTVGFSNVTALADFLATQSFEEKHAPFSVDYELYAQGMLQTKPEKVILGLFANVGIPIQSSTSPTELESICSWLEGTGRYYSASFHSYLVS